jgi:hypothetical protein
VASEATRGNNRAGNEHIGTIPNKTFGIFDPRTAKQFFRTTSDTPIRTVVLDLGIGPMVVELAPGR